jgi:hypothetical protein
MSISKGFIVSFHSFSLFFLLQGSSVSFSWASELPFHRVKGLWFFPIFSTSWAPRFSCLDSPGFRSFFSRTSRFFFIKIKHVQICWRKVRFLSQWKSWDFFYGEESPWKGGRKWEDLPFRIGGQDPPSCLSRHVVVGTTRGPGTKDPPPPPPTPAPDANSSERGFFLLFFQSENTF